MLPGAAPGPPDRGVAIAPFGFELIEPDQRHIGVFRPVDCLDPGHDGFSIFPADKGETVSDQMHDAGLDERLRKYRRNGFRKSLQAVDDGDQDVVDATDFQLVHDLEPELRAFGLLDPQAKDFFLAGRIEGKRHIHGLVLDDALVADFDPQSIEENDRIDRIERPVLPVPDFFEDGIGDPADQIWRDIDAMSGGQVLATGSPAAIKAGTGAGSIEEAFIRLLPERRRAGYREVQIPPLPPGGGKDVVVARDLTRRFGDFTAVDR